jgi:hypothetical protein
MLSLFLSIYTVSTPDDESDEEIVRILTDLHHDTLETIGERDEEEIVGEI